MPIFFFVSSSFYSGYEMYRFPKPMMPETKFDFQVDWDTDLNIYNIRQAIETGRIWATFACTHLGGASECPTIESLNSFKEEIPNISDSGTKAIDNNYVNIIDKAYSRCYVQNK